MLNVQLRGEPVGSAEASKLMQIKSTEVGTPAQRLEARAGQHRLGTATHIHLIFQPGVPQNTEGFLGSELCI